MGWGREVGEVEEVSCWAGAAGVTYQILDSLFKTIQARWMV